MDQEGKERLAAHKQALHQCLAHKRLVLLKDLIGVRGPGYHGVEIFLGDKNAKIKRVSRKAQAMVFQLIRSELQPLYLNPEAEIDFIGLWKKVIKLFIC